MAKKIEKSNKKENRKKGHFMKDFKAELKKVIWPTPKQLFNNTVAVIVIVLVIVAIVFVLDIVFELFNKNGITKLQQYVETTYVNDTTNENVTTDNTTTENNENSVTNTENTQSNTENQTSNEIDESSIPVENTTIDNTTE